jgi:hypothetical protein
MIVRFHLTPSTAARRFDPNENTGRTAVDQLRE